MVNSSKPECSVSNWYPIFAKNALEAELLPIPNEVFNYLQHDVFVLPVEASSSVTTNSEWTDGSSDGTESSDVIKIVMFI